MQAGEQIGGTSDTGPPQFSKNEKEGCTEERTVPRE
jgi:hypothetical protein